MFKPRHFFIVVCSLALLSCSHKETVHGHYVQDIDLEKIKIGQTTKMDARRILGTPSAADPFKDQDWYYIGQTNRKKIFQKPEILDRQITILSFNENNVLVKIQELDLDDSQDIDMASAKTRTAGKSPSFVQQFVGNFGRFKKQQIERHGDGTAKKK